MKKSLLRLVLLPAMLAGINATTSTPAQATSIAYSAECAPGRKGIEVYKKTPEFSSVGRQTGYRKDYIHTAFQSHAWFQFGPSTSPDTYKVEAVPLGNCRDVKVVGNFSCLLGDRYGNNWQPVDLISQEYVYPEGRFSRQPLAVSSSHRRKLPQTFWPEGGVKRLSKDDCLYWISNGASTVR